MNNDLHPSPLLLFFLTFFFFFIYHPGHMMDHHCIMYRARRISSPFHLITSPPLHHLYHTLVPLRAQDVAAKALKENWRTIFNGDNYDAANQQMLTDRGSLITSYILSLVHALILSQTYRSHYLTNICTIFFISIRQLAYRLWYRRGNAHDYGQERGSV
jgi:hypothetical protein